MTSPLLSALRSRTLLFDGGMGTQVHKLDLDVQRDYLGCENCTDVLCLSRPDEIGAIHRAYLEAGSDAVTTNSFGGARHVLEEFGLEDRTYELNKTAAEIARREADAFSTPDRPRFVLGSLGPGTKLITLGQIGWDKLSAAYREAAEGLVAGGVDAILLETCQDLLQVKCAVQAAREAIANQTGDPMSVPLLVSVTIELTGTMLVGSSIEAAIETLRPLPIDGLGLNCATGPVEMIEPVRVLGELWDRPITVMPNAGLPVLQDGRTVYPLQPKGFVEAMGRLLDLGVVSAVGGCCGTTPEHIRQLRVAVETRPAPPARTIAAPAASSSLFSVVEHRQDSSALLIGERCNASGSRAFKRLLEAEDWDGIVSLARSQVKSGSHLLDVNVDVAGRDNPKDMREIVARLSREVDAPLMLDSTQAATIEAGLQSAAGRCVINSANFEDGEKKFDHFCGLAKRYGAALVIGTIDEDPEEAMARTRERKLAIAERAIDRATNVHGLRLEDIFIDPLVLPVSTGMDGDRRSAMELIEGVRLIARRFPTVQITCGLSNASFGLKPAARVALNSVLMHELTEAGLTSAILHAGSILPLAKIPAEQIDACLAVIYDKRAISKGGTGLPEGVTDENFDPLQALIDLFADIETVNDTGPTMADLPLPERLRRHIIEGELAGLNDALDQALAIWKPLDIVNDHLLDGMKTVGEQFASGQMQLPFVLRSAEVMKKAVAYLEPHMEKVEGQTRGSIVLATVKGDVHDIGKNLVDIILSNNGYTVHNIGIKQPINEILDALERTKADAIGLSGLLVKSVHVMEENLHELNARGITVPVLLGGAALTRTYAESHLKSIYKGPLYYGKDAFEGLAIMDRLRSSRTAEIEAQIAERQAKRSAALEKVAAGCVAGVPPLEDRPSDDDDGVRSDVARSVKVPEAPFFGSRIVESISLREVFSLINPTALYSVQWQIKRGQKSKAEHKAQLDEVARPVFKRLCAQAEREGILTPRVAYGYFPCRSEGNAVVILDPDDQATEIERMVFPRQPRGRRLCIADFFRDAEECDRAGGPDVIGISCVTMGEHISEHCQRLFDTGAYQDYLYWHGLGVEAAAGLAELWHKRMRQELGIAGDDATTPEGLFKQGYRGSRYSFGYPACPDMAAHEVIWRLIDPTRIGCTLTENHQIVPEQSTSAIVVHHPEARYFNA
ncbi:MAG: methionine synthase [Planctomycetota bacterium]|nr:MAG: methionine synthase [Planctomycetota bacterium]